MADKQITIDVPEERVPEFYAWFAEFLIAGDPGSSRGERGGPVGPGGPGAPDGDPDAPADPGEGQSHVPGDPARGFRDPGGPFAAEGPFGGPWRGAHRRHRGRGFGGPPRDPTPWSPEDRDESTWIYHKLSGGARQLFDLLIDHPGQRYSGNELARELGLDKGSHGVAGVLAWPGRWCRKLGRPLPLETVAREDSGTDFFMTEELADLFRAARERGPHRP